MMAFRFFGIINHLFVYINIYIVYGIPFSLCFLIDHVGLAVTLARIPVSTLMCVYAHINPSVKRVLDTSIMTRKVN